MLVAIFLVLFQHPRPTGHLRGKECCIYDCKYYIYLCIKFCIYDCKYYIHLCIKFGNKEAGQTCARARVAPPLVTYEVGHYEWSGASQASVAVS